MSGHIYCIGLSHQTAPVELRERLSYGRQELTAALQQAAAADFAELAILFTCNRLELYAYLCADDGFARLRRFLADTKGVPVATFAASLYQYTDLAAAEHLCRVAAGLDSMVLGEPQILGQVTQACELAQQQQSIGPILRGLFQAAIRTGKRARTETDISRGALSISSVAVRLAARIAGQLHQKHTLILGAGEMAQLALKGLAAQGKGQITIINRSADRATSLAQHWGAESAHLSQLPMVLATADVVITATGAPHLLIDQDMVEPIMQTRADRPLILIDLAVPRDIDPAVGDIAGVHLFDVDDLHNEVSATLAERENEVPHVQAIIQQEVDGFATWMRAISVRPLIINLRQKAEAIRQKEVERTLRFIPDLDEETRHHITHLSQSIVNKLLHEPTVRLRNEAKNGFADAYADTIRFLFALEEEEQD